MSLNKKTVSKTNAKIKVVNSDSDSNNEAINKNDNSGTKDVIIKKNIGGGRPKKAEKYKKEREEILNKLNDILGITSENKKFFMWDVDNNKEIQKKIMDLKDDVSKYFCAKQSSIYTNDNPERDYFILLRMIYKEMNIKLIHADTKILRNDKKVYSGCYMLDK